MRAPSCAHGRAVALNAVLFALLMGIEGYFIYPALSMPVLAGVMSINLLAFSAGHLWFCHKTLSPLQRELEIQQQAAVKAETHQSVLEVNLQAQQEKLDLALEQAQQSQQRFAQLLEDIAHKGLDASLSQSFTDAYPQFAQKLQLLLKAFQQKLGKTKADMAATIAASPQNENRHDMEQMAGAVGEITAHLNLLFQHMQQQEANLQQTTHSMEEISSTTRQNSDNAQQANQLATAMRHTAEKGGQVAGEAVLAIERIEQSAKRISDIIRVMDGIAAQTNLLALNASVEAARAGEAGRGFAVVAGEVRALALRSTQASKEIKLLITDSNTQVHDGAELVRRAGDTLGDIVGSVKRVADIVAEIAAATREQATGIEQVNQAVARMDTATQENSAVMQDSLETARRMQNHLAVLNGGKTFVMPELGQTKPKAKKIKTAEIEQNAHHASSGDEAWDEF